jgi:hypothetical protein
MKKLLMALAVFFGLGMVATTVEAADSGSQDMYRLYNKTSGEHFYTANRTEAQGLVNVGWSSEGIGFVAPKHSNTPVYRLYNKNAGDHHYTTSAFEKDSLVKTGWAYEGIGWYSSDAKKVKLLRAYNPHAQAGSHNYTTNPGEQSNLVRVGWKDEGIAWYAIGFGTMDRGVLTPAGGSTPAAPATPGEDWSDWHNAPDGMAYYRAESNAYYKHVKNPDNYTLVKDNPNGDHPRGNAYARN